MNVERFIKRRLLLVGFLAVLVPLGVLLGLQYRWLTTLQKTSAVAEKAWLSNYLEAVSSEIEYFYRTQAERTLNVPSSLFSKPDKLGRFFRKKAAVGARYVFAVQYVDKQDWGNFTAFDPATGSADPTFDADTYQAVSVALSPWRILAYKGAPVLSHQLAVDEMDPDNVVIINPITDDACQLIGIAGMIVDRHYFEEKVLPGAIEKSLPKFFDERARENLIITVRDGRGRLVVGSEKDVEEVEQARGTVPFIFTDWQLGLGSRYTTPEEWAKSNFLLNITISVVLGVVLLGGVLLTLRTASREMKLSQMKSDFVSNVSHELRTPLASIRVFGEFLRLGRAPDTDKCREYGEYIETESRRLTQLINNILDFSKIESGAKTYHFERVGLIPVVEETLNTMRVGLKHLGFRLEFEPPAAPLPPLRIDPDAVSQALANLVDNAVKYSGDEREVRVRVTQENGRVVIAVQDRGIGISRREQVKIFERFHRAGSTLVHDVKGSGLGLSIVRHIVRAHDGEITLHSEPGRGSTFAIRLPVHAPASEVEPHVEATVGSAHQVEKT